MAASVAAAEGGADFMGCNPAPVCEVNPGDSRWFRICCSAASSEAEWACWRLGALLSTAELLLRVTAVFEPMEFEAGAGLVLHAEMAHIHSCLSLADSAARCVLRVELLCEKLKTRMHRNDCPWSVF